jgi:RimJ/RimL family protein N-acetyltransferase
MKIIPFEPEHLKDIKVQGGQLDWQLYNYETYGAELKKAGMAYTAVDNEGRIIGCAGIIKIWTGRGEAWALFGGGWQRHYIGITKAVLRGLRLSNLRRIEANVRADFDKAQAWITYLGFNEEGYMRKYGADGADFIRYARIR